MTGDAGRVKRRAGQSGDQIIRQVLPTSNGRNAGQRLLLTGVLGMVGVMTPLQAPIVGTGVRAMVEQKSHHGAFVLDDGCSQSVGDSGRCACWVGAVIEQAFDDDWIAGKHRHGHDIFAVRYPRLQVGVVVQRNIQCRQIAALRCDGRHGTIGPAVEQKIYVQQPCCLQIWIDGVPFRILLHFSQELIVKLEVETRQRALSIDQGTIIQRGCHHGGLSRVGRDDQCGLSPTHCIALVHFAQLLTYLRHFAVDHIQH